MKMLRNYIKMYITGSFETTLTLPTIESTYKVDAVIIKNAQPIRIDVSSSIY